MATISRDRRVLARGVLRAGRIVFDDHAAFAPGHYTLTLTDRQRRQMISTRQTIRIR